VVEYGNGISKGPAGQVGGGTYPLAQGGDPLASANRFVNDSWAWLSHLGTVELVVLAVAIFVSLLILRRVF
jgi:hypothetical protein